MAVGLATGASTGFYQRQLYVDDYACLVRRDHPFTKDGWSEAAYRDAQHALSTPVHGAEPGHIAEALTSISPHQCSFSPNTLSAAMAVVESDMVLTVPRRVATKLSKLLTLTLLDCPVSIPTYQVMLLWHERTHRHSDYEWIRSQIVRCSLNADPTSPG
jgi:DNA-binding transcriptional LysR family regulator